MEPTDQKDRDATPELYVRLCRRAHFESHLQALAFERRSDGQHDVGQAALDVHRNAHQGKVGVLTLAPEAGLGVTDTEKRSRFVGAINRFRDA